ncbi:WcaA Glycosyltransferases involved in cell wall biogenesis [Candidatus Nanopelagicaceae bacterium]
MLTVVIPAYNESESLPFTIEEVSTIVKKLGTPFEILVINDGSSDATENVLAELQKKYFELRAVSFSKNQGHMEALSLGMNLAKGEFVVTMDADLQDPPELITNMYEIISKNHDIDIVQAVRDNRDSDSFFKRQSAAAYYRISRAITGVEVIPHAADFRMIRRTALEIINGMPERRKILRFLIPHLGFHTEIVYFTRAARVSGESKYHFKAMVKLATESIVSFSAKPLRVFSILGITAAAILLLGSLISLIIWLAYQTVPGWTSLALLVLSGNALILAGIGLLGQYVSRIYDNLLDRPHPKFTEIFRK